MKLLQVALLFTFVMLVAHVPTANLSFLTRRQDIDRMQVCLENCAQCVKTLGAWFEGPLCADACIASKGKQIPDCEDLSSISPFLNKELVGDLDNTD